MAALKRSGATPSAEFWFASSDGLRIACARWDSHGPARGMVQIAHGMGERIGRYADTIEFLRSAGLTVYGNDHRGHGRTAPSAEQLGDFGPGGFPLLVEDIYKLTSVARSEHPDLPLILLGHSMGSFAAQCYVLDHSDKIDGLALSGSGSLLGLARLVNSGGSAGNLLNAAFEPARTPCDWLSRDDAVVDAFLRDPLCFGELKPAAFASFLAMADRLADPVELTKIRCDLPIYLFSGSDDPVGQQLRGVKTLIELYRQAGILEVDHDFYPGGRHEMLNEINRDAVRTALLRWITPVLDRAKAQRRLPAGGHELSL